MHQFVVDRHLAERGLTNYWGYNSIGFFAPDVRYAAKGLGNQVYEFKSMVKTLHSAGIEVILDVVYNHTGEGNHLGPTLSLRGIDNRAYYRLDQDQRFYTDFTGTGNSLNMQHPRTIQLIMDSLRYWVNDMHVDGFRFDLAPVLARELHDVDKLSAFFDIIHQDPTLANVKLIAEPWDVGPGGYQVGNFPIRWAEWNGSIATRCDTSGAAIAGRFPSSRRASPARATSTSRAAADRTRASTSSRRTTATRCYDLVSYEQKHNEANGEDNRDGHNDNISRNWGVEGETDDPQILDMRFRVMRDFIATLAFSQGVPMLSHGDEIARTQCGNNNAYAQDNETTVGALGSRRPPQAAARVHAEVSESPARARRAAPAALLPRRTDDQGRAQGSVVDSRRRREMTDADWHDAEQPRARHVDLRRRDRRDRRSRPSDQRARRCCWLLNGGDGDRVHASDAGSKAKASGPR